MKHLITITFFLAINVVFAQQLKLPRKPYVIVIGKDTLKTRTVIEKAPDSYENYTLANKEVYANVDSLRVWTYLQKEEKYSITFPTRIDTVPKGTPCCLPPPPPEIDSVEMFKPMTFDELYWIDTTDHIEISKLIDTISVDELRKLLTTEINIYYGTRKLQTRQIRVALVWPNGKTFEYDCDGSKIGSCSRISDDSKTISPNGYLILNRIWFYDEKNKPHGISEKIGWKIE